MDSFEFNKIIGAVLGTLLFVMGIGFVAEAIYAPHEDVGPGYALPEPELAAAAGEPVEAPPEVPLAVLLASADPARGQAAVRKCQSCHNFGEGEPSKTGPHLYGVVGRPEGGIADFSYSDGMMAHNAAGDVWTYENINTFITSPKAYVADTKMNFSGVKSPEERADILAYLQTLSHDPVPFPEPEAAPAADDAAAPPADDAGTEDAAAPADAAAAPTDTESPAPADDADATAPAEAAAPVATPTTTGSETPVEGTATSSGTDGAAPADAETPAQEAPAEAPAPAPTEPATP